MTVEFETLSPEERTVRILVMGHPIALRRFQHIQHSFRFAEPNDWSPILLQPSGQILADFRPREVASEESETSQPGGNSSEAPQGITMLIKTLR